MEINTVSTLVALSLLLLLLRPFFSSFPSFLLFIISLFVALFVSLSLVIIIGQSQFYRSAMDPVQRLTLLGHGFQIFPIGIGGIFKNFF